jgi:hypothetical protein
MALTYSTTLRNNQANEVESTIGASAKLKLRTGAPPSNVGAASTGTVVAELDLPSDWLGVASNGTVSKIGTWSGVGASAAGGGTNVGHFELTQSNGTTVHIRGTVTATGDEGDMTLDNINIAEDQAVTVTSFDLTRGNAGA